ncbi:Uncharacterised protein [Serratia fonticola]|uniref:Uncharacterized protein n=1 Tax=Serratia fonticola TaxID=47917 RepID=A0A4U9UHP3_SERFO|nr:Uncharacterised protein [Serratia fonticola]
MNEVDEFIEIFDREKIIYSSWGELVLQHICDCLVEKDMESIFKNHSII